LSGHIKSDFDISPSKNENIKVKDLIGGLHNFTTANLRGRFLKNFKRKPIQVTSEHTKKPQMKEDLPKFSTLDL